MNKSDVKLAAPIRGLVEEDTLPLGASIHRWSESEIGPIEQVVLQATPFCNINCSYCYLPRRDRLDRMSLETSVRVIEFVVESGRYGGELEIRWHAGEPLVVPVDFYRQAIRAMRRAAPSALTLRHSLQTNGILIDEEWCEFFGEEGIDVGLSIDGPAFLHDRMRVTRSGQGTHQAVMRAVELLRSRGVPYSALAVLTDESLNYPDELFAFFSGIAPSRLAFNVEETEGIHQSGSMVHASTLARFRFFMSRIYDLQQSNGCLRIREIDSMRDAILFGRENRGNRMSTPFKIVTVDCEGNLSSFSPELLGHSDQEYGSFHFGNIWRNTLHEMLSSPSFLRVAADIEAGVEACRRSCNYFSLCGGGAPSNKLCENGSFASTQTFHCRTNIMTLVDLCLNKLENDGG